MSADVGINQGDRLRVRGWDKDGEHEYVGTVNGFVYTVDKDSYVPVYIHSIDACWAVHLSNILGAAE